MYMCVCLPPIRMVHPETPLQVCHTPGVTPPGLALLLFLHTNTLVCLHQFHSRSASRRNK